MKSHVILTVRVLPGGSTLGHRPQGRETFSGASEMAMTWPLVLQFWGVVNNEHFLTWSDDYFLTWSVALRSTIFDVA